MFAVETPNFHALREWSSLSCLSDGFRLNFERAPDVLRCIVQTEILLQRRAQCQNLFSRLFF